MRSSRSAWMSRQHGAVALVYSANGSPAIISPIKTRTHWIVSLRESLLRRRMYRSAYVAPSCPSHSSYSVASRHADQSRRRRTCSRSDSELALPLVIFWTRLTSSELSKPARSYPCAKAVSNSIS